MGDIGSSIKIRGGVSRAGDAVVLSELGLVRTSRTTNAAVRGGIIMMSGGTMNCTDRQMINR